MCGRFTITLSAGEIQTLLNDQFSVSLDALADKPRYNIAPTMETLALLYDGKDFRAGMIPWGLRFERNQKPILAFNTRIETIEEKPFFNTLYTHNRIAFLSNGYFEWDQTDKTPYWMHYPHQDPMFLGGIWRKDHTYQGSVITLKAPEKLAHIHPRVPFSMPLDHVHQWLKEGTDHPTNLFVSPTDITPLTNRVNKVTHNDASILEPR